MWGHDDDAPDAPDGDAGPGFPNRRHYDAAAEHPEQYADHERERFDDEDLAEIAHRHLAHIHLPHLPIPGLSTIEKKLIFFICDHTGAPNPFHALERLTGDGVELERAERAWGEAQDRVDEVTLMIHGAVRPYPAQPQPAVAPDPTQGGAADPGGAPTRPTAAAPQTPEAAFDRALGAYLHEIAELSGSLGTTRDCLKAIRSEAQLAENTILMLINLLIGSLGGLLVAEFVTAGTVTPVAAAQAQIELAYVGKKIAFIAGKVHLLYVDATKVFAAVRGFRAINAARFVFESVPEVTAP